MNKPKDIKEAIQRARMYGTPTYVMLADEIEKHNRLYELVNTFMAELGAEGEIALNAQSEFANEWMGALWDIDGGCQKGGPE